MKQLAVIVTAGMLFCAGCEGIRFGPSEAQKQNTWVHNLTAAMALQKAQSEQVAENYG
jgi:hypothetical protein